MKASRRISTATETVAATLRELPDDVRKVARTVTVRFERKPAPEVLADVFEADLLGLFTGWPHGHEGGADPLLPPQIHLYIDNLWDFAEEDPAVFRDEVRLTFLHELGHFLGWDEDEIAARGLD